MQRNEGRVGSLADRVVVVTGATRGIGVGISRALADKGASVVLTGRSEDSGTAAAAAIVDAGGRADFISCDITSESDVRGLMSIVGERHGRLDGVVNNAAPLDVIRGGGEAPVVDEPIETFEHMLRVGVVGAFAICKYAIPLMRLAGSGSIVNISSIAAHIASRRAPGYAAAKGALEALSRQMAADFGGEGIRSNSIVVGFIRTEANERLHADDDVRSSLEAMTMLGRAGVPADVGALCAFLLSDDAAYLTGATIPLEAGLTVMNPIQGVRKVYSASQPSTRRTDES